ncbi:hypothetical protein Ancab_001310 [Ancistrocladus abbreviatus]
MGQITMRKKTLNAMWGFGFMREEGESGVGLPLHILGNSFRIGVLMRKGEIERGPYKRRDGGYKAKEENAASRKHPPYNKRTRVAIMVGI